MKAIAGAAAAFGLCCSVQLGVFAAVTGVAVWSWAGPPVAVVSVVAMLLLARRRHDGPLGEGPFGDGPHRGGPPPAGNRLRAGHVEERCTR